jgi:nucleoside-diphosphate-sugar epimerase
MATILVIGGGGFIARHAAARLVAEGHSVCATYRPTSPIPPIQGVHWIPSDLTHDDPTHAWPRHCDVVVYLAQAREWRTFPAAAPDILSLNVTCLLRAADYCSRACAQKLLFASTGSIYSETRKPAIEDQPVDVLCSRSFYAASKLAGELLLRPYASAFDVIILRLFMPYGPGQDNRMLLPSIVRKVREAKPIQLHYPDGLVANPVAVDDIAEVICRVLTCSGSPTLNVAGPHELTLRDIASMVGRLLSREPLFETTPGPAPVIVGDCSALRRALNWMPQIDFPTGLRAWLAANPPQLAAAG